MPSTLWTGAKVDLVKVHEDDLALAQYCFDQTPSYHQLVMGEAADPGMARRCLHAPIPRSAKSLKVFKYFAGALRSGSSEWVGLMDLYVAYPKYDAATIASFLVREPLHRRGWGSAMLESLEAWLGDCHPATSWLDITITDDNHVATRFLQARGFERTDDWHRIPFKGKERLVARFEKRLDRAPSSGLP
ncbi:MAG: GNAT family N-acetyltransferase [Myxococcota bacterium]|jgi:GNAT superfamily N-acetyltransferase|nr:GNAT family N-acetyltransferase [Myxococcota bacterium]